MHEFRWMAPLRVGFTSSPGVMDREPGRYRAMWDQLAERVVDRRWTLHRSSKEEAAPLGWSKADADTLDRSLQVVTGSLDPADFPAREGLEVIELSWSLYDHGVFLAEGRLRTTADVDERTLRDADHWEAAVQRVGEDLARHCAEVEHATLSRELLRLRDAESLLVMEDMEIGRPLWVTRSLAFDESAPGAAEFARAWVSTIDGHHRDAVEELIRGERPLVAQWMNHIYRPELQDPVQLSWRALQKAQFFWSAMTWVDDSLRQILAWSMADHGDVSVRQLRQELRATMNQAQELLMLRAEVRQRVSRRSHEEMQRFLGVWEYAELLETPVREKVEICKERLSALSEDRAARSAMITDIILMCIGVTSVLATAIALVQFGRDAGQDPAQSVFDLGNGSITSWLSSQSMDAILIISLVLSVCLVGVFIWKRRQSIS